MGEACPVCGAYLREVAELTAELDACERALLALHASTQRRGGAAVMEENPFTEADARLGAMHGYAEPLHCVSCGARHGLGVGCTGTTGGVPSAPPTREDVRRLEAKVDALIVALRSGAVGKWTS